MRNEELTRAEGALRVWMLICAILFGFAVPFFLFGGVWIVPAINAISARICSLPLYALPESGMEGAFWRVLGVSMMAMLTWVCVAASVDVRRNCRLVPIMLVSKLCSTLCYLGLFIAFHPLAYLVGVLTDGPIFLVTLALWYLSSPGDRYIDDKEERILAAIGGALVPRGGAFELGYADLRDRCVAGVRRMMAVMDPVALLGTRLLFRTVNLSPILFGLRGCTLLGMLPEDRPGWLTRLERHRLGPVRMMIVAVKAYAAVPFFNEPEAAQAVGYEPESGETP